MANKPKVELVFNEWKTADDVDELDGLIDHIALMIDEYRNKWVLPYLVKQLEAFETLRKIPLQK